MTFRVDIGIDPGCKGAVAVLADGRYDGVEDLPHSKTSKGTNEVNGAALAMLLRDVRLRHPGATFLVSIERVGNMPRFGKGGTPIKMGASTMFAFGLGAGIIRGVVQALGLPYDLPPPATWKAGVGLTGKPKDYSRTVAIQRFPEAAHMLKRVKDDGRADALMLARYGYQNEQGIEQRVAQRDEATAAF